jgi:CubicO group peptidase (beta-lactamase class C family)
VTPITPTPVRRTRIAVLITTGLLLATALGCTPQTPSPDVVAAIDGEVRFALDIRDRGDRIRAVLVLQEGQPVYERYIGSGPDDYWDVRSVTKSVTATLIGIAIDRGLIGGIDSTLAELLPSHSADLTAETGRISLSAVLTHTANFPLETDDNQEVGEATDLVSAILVDRAARGPGDGTFHYSNAGAHILAAILVDATHMPVLTFARQYLFDPLEIATEPEWEFPPATTDEEWEALLDSYDEADFAWPADPQGVHFGFGYLRLRPSDLARIGELYRSKGVFEGNRIVSNTWIAQATSPQLDRGAASTTNYGYQWWIESSQGYFWAQGQGGTVVLVHPAKDAVIVVASQIDGRENFEPGVLAVESARSVAESVLAALD